jgi:hypothetical protein
MPLLPLWAFTACPRVNFTVTRVLKGPNKVGFSGISHTFYYAVRLYSSNPSLTLSIYLFIFVVFSHVWFVSSEK